jgi:hypothetical protein
LTTIDTLVQIRIGAFTSVANDKRQSLKLLASKWTQRRRYLNLTASVLALISGSAFLGLFGDLAPPLWIKLTGAILALLSGFVGLLVDQIYSELELSRIWEGATGFLQFRERCAQFELESVSLSAQEKYDRFRLIEEQYSALDEEFGRCLILYKGNSMTGYLEEARGRLARLVAKH